MLLDLIKGWIDAILLAISDYFHPGQKEAREAIEGNAEAQNEAIERHEAIDKVLTSESRELDQKIADDEAKLDDILKPLPKVERTQDEEFELLSKRIKK